MKTEPIMLMNIDTTKVVLNDVALCTDPSRKRNQSKSCVIDGVQYASFTNKTWIGDSGASCHLDNDDSGMYDVEDINDIIGMPDGKSTVRATKKGRKQFVIEQLDGTTAIKEFYPVNTNAGTGVDLRHFLYTRGTRIFTSPCVRVDIRFNISNCSYDLNVQ